LVAKVQKGARQRDRGVIRPAETGTNLIVEQRFFRKIRTWRAIRGVRSGQSEEGVIINSRDPARIPHAGLPCLNKPEHGLMCPKGKLGPRLFEKKKMAWIGRRRTPAQAASQQPRQRRKTDGSLSKGDGQLSYRGRERHCPDSRKVWEVAK